MKKLLAGITATVLCAGLAVSELPQNIGNSAIETLAADTVAITNMEYFSANDGPVISESGTDSASYGFVMPIINGGSASFDDAANDLAVNVKSDGKWVSIDDLPEFVYNGNWGLWYDSGFTGYWFTVSETTEIQLASKSNPDVTLEYKLIFSKLDKEKITSMTSGEVTLSADRTGGSGFVYPTFNNDVSVKYEQVAEDLKVSVKTGNSDWVDIDNNASSGWIYDSNWGQFWDGPGGYWFHVTETTYVRLSSKSDSSVFIDYTITYEKAQRNSYELTPEGTTELKAGENGEVGLVLPNIGGVLPYNDDLGGFVYEILVGEKWVPLADSYYSGYTYQANGYRKNRDANQWGYFADSVYGLWFQPVTEDTEIRVGYPSDGIAGHDCGDNYVTYYFTGNPDAYRPNPTDYEDIELGSVENSDIEGWKLIWNDEFDESEIDSSKWTHQTGYYLNDDPGTWGWGNAELEYYTDSPKNSYTEDGKLVLKLLDEPKTFPQDPDRTAPYSSGKLISQDKFSFKYGRIDFSAKLPTGSGIWPALWMMPNDEAYGVWAASGEIDVMEARGRIPNSVCGTIHYGGSWPNNKNTGNDYYFPEGSTFDDGFHVYSCVWTEDAIKWYVDGNCYSVIRNDEWYSEAASDNPYAPFDQEFYIIMNLAAGGWFDGGIAPDAESIPGQMEIEYVRVYKEAEYTSVKYGDTNCDGTVSLSDAVLILQSIASNDKFGVGGTDENAITPQGIINADCYEVGSGVTANDALAVQKYLLKLVDSLPIE